MSGFKKALLCLSSACLFILPEANAAASSAPICADPVARVVTIQGDVRIRVQQSWQPAALEQALCAGDELKVFAGGRSALRLGSTTLPLDQNTHLILRGHSPDGKTLQIELLSGNINVATDALTQIQINTPHGNVSTAGGDFAVSVSQQQAALAVFGGKVAVSNPEGSLDLLSDETAYFALWSAPKRDITVKARDSVQWVVQYPALLPSGVAQPSAWAEAARQYEQGRVLNALIALEQVPKESRNADYYNYRANIYLLSGRAADAMSDIEQAKKLNPKSADTWALQAIHDLGQNNSVDALAHAEKAIRLNPESPAAQLAHSYALQAKRKPEEALTAARRMIELAPDNALGHTRAAELELARGDRTASLRAAQRGAALAPNSSEAQSILGFAQLSLDQDSAARSAFDTAVRLNSADPRARMGLGLARIRQSQLQAGREDLELAASLDPDNPLLRAYLGRAYAEEGRTQEAAEQYARAKRSDPQDPTAFFFSALLLADNNQLTAALEQLRESQVRNENRAVYRGAFLLADDNAIRTANAVGLLHKLGMPDAARVEASSALATNPQSGVLHRALADALADTSRSDPTRRSEYLQASLLSPLGSMPPPLFQTEDVRRGSLAPTSGFFKVVEPGQTGQNEFSAVYGAASWRWQVEGILADKGTIGDQVRLAGTQGNLGWSLSQLKFKTNGFTDFSKLESDVWQGIIQANLNPGTRVHLEAYHADSARQVIDNSAEPFYYVPLDTTEKRSRNRVALHQQFSPHHSVLLLGTQESIDQIQDWIPAPILELPTTRQFVAQDSWTYEAQYRYLGEGVQAAFGAIDSRLNALYDDGSGSTSKIRTRAQTTYMYGSINLPVKINFEVGGSYDRQWDDQGFKQDFYSPKIGLKWTPLTGGQLRMASFSGVDHSLTSSASLEPAQVAGFNQAYSEKTTALVRSRSKSLAWDQIGEGGSWGVERNWRNIAPPAIEDQQVKYSKWTEHTTRAYAAWVLPKSAEGGWFQHADKTLSIAYDSEKRSRFGNKDSDRILEYEPQNLKLTLAIAGADSYSMNLSVTRVRAKGIYLVNDEAAEFFLKPFSSKFWIVDGAVTYPFAGRRSQITLGVMNLTNRRNTQYLEPDPLNPRVALERFLYAKLQLSY